MNIKCPPNTPGYISNLQIGGFWKIIQLKPMMMSTTQTLYCNFFKQQIVNFFFLKKWMLGGYKIKVKTC
jgi:hypothetical protein